MNITLFELHLDDATIAPALSGAEPIAAQDTTVGSSESVENSTGRSWGRLLGLLVVAGVGVAAAAWWRRNDEYEVEVEVGDETEAVITE